MERSDFLIWHENDDPEFVGALYESYAADTECVQRANLVGHDLRKRIVHPAVKVWSEYASSAERACSDIEWSQSMRTFCLNWHEQPCSDSDCP